MTSYQDENYVFILLGPRRNRDFQNLKKLISFFWFLSKNLKNTARGVHRRGGGPAEAVVNFAGQFDLDIYPPGQVLAAPNHLHPMSEEVVSSTCKQFFTEKKMVSSSRNTGF